MNSKELEATGFNLSQPAGISLKGDLPFLSLLYLLAFACVYLKLPVPIRVFVMIIMIFVSLQSFEKATSIFLVVLFMPFFTEFLGFRISGLNGMRLMSFVYLYVAFRTPPQRTLQINRVLLILILLSMISIMASAELRKMVQESPENDPTNSPGLLNFLARSYDTVITFVFIYLSLTRLTRASIANLIDILLVCGLLQALTIIFLVAKSPESVIGDQFDKFYLWRNPYFGHKNDWGMVMMFIVLIAYIRRKVAVANKSFYLIVMIVVSVAVAFSLSRQAYISLVMGFLIISVLQKDSKPALYLTIGLLFLVFAQPGFLLNRMDSFLSVESLEDFQGLSRKVGDLAINQFKANLTLIPRMFMTEWEYNWSEGFWNGLTHQQGILGLVFHVFFYAYLIYRYYVISRSNVRNLSLLASLMCAIWFIVFIANFNRRGINLMHYDAKMQTFGFILLFMILFTEFWLHHYRQLADKKSH